VTSPAVAEALAQLVAAAVVDEAGTVRWVSGRLCAMAGLEQADLLGRQWQDVIRPVPEDRTDPHTARCRSERADFPALITSSGGTPRPFQFEMQRIEEGTGSGGWLLVGRERPAVAPSVPDAVAPPSVAGTSLATEVEADALSQSQRRLQVIFDHSADAVIVLHPDGSWRSAKSSGPNPFGIPGDADPMDVVHPDDLDAVRQAVAEIGATTDPSHANRFEFRVRGPGGRWLWLETRGVNLVDDPAVRGIVLHSRDVTEAHEAAAELSSTASRLSSLVSNLFVGVIMADQLDELIFANLAASQMFGLGRDPDRLVRMAGGMLSAHLQRLHRDIHALERIAEIVEDRRVVMEERIELTNGRTLARSFVPIFDGGTYRGHLWLYRDLTDEIAVAAEREYLLRMEKEQNARLTELDSLKSDLVASVSHELRTPLTSIVSFTHLLRDGLGTDGVADQAEFLDIITRNTDRLLRLVDDLLLLDRLESNSLQVSNEWVDFPSLVEIAVSSIRPAAKEKGVTLLSESVSGPPLVGDVDRLGQLIDNLLANAVKFTPPKGQVRTEVTRTDDAWRLVVSDTGIGIPIDEQHQLFQRFYRASNARQVSASGSGLGLLIALRITELHQGSIDVASVEGRGTTVTVELRGAARPSLPPSPLTESLS
jgi:PAS domain S-box-containing protein